MGGIVDCYELSMWLINGMFVVASVVDVKITLLNGSVIHYMMFGGFNNV